MRVVVFDAACFSLVCVVVAEFLMIVQPLLNQNTHDRHSYFEGTWLVLYLLMFVCERQVTKETS